MCFFVIIRLTYRLNNHGKCPCLFGTIMWKLQTIKYRYLFFLELHRRVVCHFIKKERGGVQKKRGSTHSQHKSLYRLVGFTKRLDPILKAMTHGLKSGVSNCRSKICSTEAPAIHQMLLVLDTACITASKHGFAPSNTKAFQCFQTSQATKISYDIFVCHR
jgi:hypothetical protein